MTTFHSPRKKFLSAMLAVLMLLSTAAPVFADLFAFVTVEDEPVYIAGELTSGDEGETYAVFISFDETAKIPEGSRLETKELLQDDPYYDTYRSLALEKAGVEENDGLLVRLFDISIMADEEKVQPAEGSKVDVKITIDELKDASEGSKITVLHFPDVEEEAATEEAAEEIIAEDLTQPEGLESIQINDLKAFGTATPDVMEDEDDLLPDTPAEGIGRKEMEEDAPEEDRVRIEEPELIESELVEDGVIFTADGFSIYAIVDDGGETVVPRRTYVFVKLNEDTGAIEPYYFYNNAGEKVDNQIVKTGDVLEAINTPYIPDEQTWEGWRVANITGLDEHYAEGTATGQNYTSISYGRAVVFGEPLTVTENETIYIIPYLGQYHTITFIDYLFSEDKVTGYLIHNKEEVPLGTTYDTTVQTVPNHKDVGDADDADLVFAGWRLLHTSSEMASYFEWNNGVLTLKDGVTWDQVDPTNGPDGHPVQGVTRDENNYVIAIEMDPDVSRNYVLLPVYEKAYWVEYYSAPTGSGATYIAPRHVGVHKTAAEAGAEPTDTMTWKGYTFQYWTTDETFDEDGKPIEFASGSEPTRYNFNQVLTSDVTLNAYWKKAETTYTVMYWRQQLSDDKNLDADEKNYDYAGQRTGTADVDSVVTLTAADLNMNSATYNGTDDDYLKYVGFSYAKDDASTKTVNADGSTVINVYYDRNLITMNFDRDIEVYAETEATTGTLYGVVDGEYVAITWNGTNWVYTTTEQVTQYVDYTGTRYNTTNVRNNNNPPHYGIVNGNVVALSRYSDNYWYTGYYNQYTGTHYVESNTGTYGFVNGSMIQLMNGQYQTTTTEDVEHIYEGTRYVENTTRSFTGLYGQQLSKYGYRWPSEYVWRYNATGNQTIGMSYLGEFVLPNDVRDTTGKVIELQASGNATNYMEFYLQDPELTDLDDVNSYVLKATGSADYQPYTNVSFTLSNKYEGYTVQGYRRYTGTGDNKRYIDNDIVPKNVNDTVSLKGRGYSYNLEVYYKVYSYNVTYKDPVTREVLANDVFNYGADIDDDGAPAKTTVESHVPVGYRLKTDEDGNIIWYADPSMEMEFNFDRTMPNHDLEVFPGFEPIWYWIKIEPNGGQLSDTESTWFWKVHGDTSVYEYTDVERPYNEDPNGTWYYHYDEFDPETELNTAGGTDRKAYYTQDSSLSTDGKTYSPSDLYQLDGWYEVTIDEDTGAEVLVPYHFGSPITHNTTLRAVWLKTGAYSTVYKNEGVDANGNPLYTYTVGDNTYLVTEENGTYTYTDDDGNTVTLSDATGLTRLTGSNAPTGGRTYEDESDTIILHRPDPPEGYVCTGYYFNGTTYIPGNVFKIQSALDGADGDVDMQFTFYPIYAPISERDVQVTNIYFDPNVDNVADVTLDAGIVDEFKDGVQKQSVNDTTKVVGFLNRQINSELTLLGEVYTRQGYTLKGWSLTSGDNNAVNFALGQENVAADNLSKDATNTAANTLYAVWEIKKYTVTVEKVVESEWSYDENHRFTFVPNFEGTSADELRNNFSLTGNEQAGTHIKTFQTLIPYGTTFSITESGSEYWNTTVKYTVTENDVVLVGDTEISNGQELTVTGNMKLTFTNKMDYAAQVTIIKTNENGTSDLTSDKINSNGNDALSGAKFRLLRKATSDGAYSEFMEDITVNRYTTLSLPQGYYQLIETQSPDGYIMSHNIWEFVVTYEGKVYAEAGQSGMLFEYSENDTSDSRYLVSGKSLIIKNEPGSALPMTGNSGTKIFIISGIALLFAAAVVNEIRLRRKEEQ